MREFCKSNLTLTNLIATVALIISCAAYMKKPNTARLRCVQGEMVADEERECTVSVINVGDSPATGIAVVLVFADGVPVPDPQAIRVYPPYPANINLKGQRLTYEFSHALGTLQTIRFLLPPNKIHKDDKRFRKEPDQWTYANYIGDPDSDTQWVRTVTAWVVSDQGQAERVNDWIGSPPPRSFSEAFSSRTESQKESNRLILR